jgi:hypothetical protein
VVGRYRAFTRAWAFGRTPGPQPFAAPALDQHGDDVRAEADASSKALPDPEPPAPQR